MNKILIIEDEEAIAELEKDYLELSGYIVEIESNGEKGLEKALSGSYDLYILDVMLPGVDGFEICKEIRKEKTTPILMVSARKEDIDKIRGLGLGADDYITKPFSPGELVARVKAHLARYDRIVESLMPENSIIKIRGIKIDTQAKEVWVNGDNKSLTSREYELLEYFIKHPNQVLSKEDIFKEIWNMDAIGDIATVTVHVKKLREKIEVDPSKPQYIETVWGMGYRFKV
jgi:DNA-binding response OmpR family regulator